jgi:hypothetical protein
MKEIIIAFIRKIPAGLFEKTDNGNCICVAGGILGIASLLFPVFIKSGSDGASYIKLYEYIRAFLLTESGFAPLAVIFILTTALSLSSIITGGLKFLSAAATFILVALWVSLLFSHVPIADCHAAVYTLSASLLFQASGLFIKI